MAFKDFLIDLFGNVKDKDGNIMGTVIGKEAVECYYKDLSLIVYLNALLERI